MRTDLTLFDLDHTLLDGDSNALWLAWLVEQGAAPAERLLRQAAFYAQYKAGSLDIDAYLRFHLSLLDGRPLADWLPLRDAFVAARIVPRIGPAAPVEKKPRKGAKKHQAYIRQRRGGRTGRNG
jgi:phosphoserine phosphatase